MKRRKRFREEEAKELPRFHLALTFQSEEERTAFQTRVYIVECPILVCMCHTKVKVSETNSRRFTHISEKKITTAAIGPFIS